MFELMVRNARIFILMVLVGLPIACSKNDKPNLEKESVIKVITWGPKSTQVRKGFLVQPNGDSVIGFEFEGPGNAHNLQVWFGEQQLSGLAVVPGKAGSATVPPKLFAEAKSIPVYLIFIPTGVKVDIGTFQVIP